MAYKIPDFSTPLEPKEYKRLRKYCINAATFIVGKFLYSKQQTVEFFTFKKRIPTSILVYKNDKDKDEDVQPYERETEPIEIINDILNELEEKEIFRDEEYAKRKAESYILRRKGETFIRRELLIKKFDENIVEKVVTEVMAENEDTYDDSFRAAADSIVRKSNFTKKEPHARKQTFITTLVRRGFDMSDIFQLINDEEYAHHFETQY